MKSKTFKVTKALESRMNKIYKLQEALNYLPESSTGMRKKIDGELFKLKTEVIHLLFQDGL